MKTLFASILDPSGHHRNLKWEEFPVKLGTCLEDRNQLRDRTFEAEAFEIARSSEGSFFIRTLQAEAVLRVNDLKLQDFEIPFGVPISLGESEITFTLQEKTQASGVVFSEKSPWYSEAPSGIDLLKNLKKASQTKLSIYLHGETGTGKEVLAKQIHDWSERVSGPFVPINCGALALSLAESELFGHVKGSFTGALRDRPGALLQAHGGTLFLDEIGDLPAELQVKLLRFLENGEIRPVGSDRTLRAEVRIVCASHKPLLELVKENKFRQDLYFRIASIPVEIPSLRERPEDIRALAIRFSQEHGKRLTQESIFKLQSSSWPGNVRELKHAIDRASGIAGPFETLLQGVDFHFLQGNRVMEEKIEDAMAGIWKLKEMEKVLILRALKMVNGNRAEAAKCLGIARSTLFEMMRRHQIVGPKSNDYWLAKVTASSS